MRRGRTCIVGEHVGIIHCSRSYISGTSLGKSDSCYDLFLGSRHPNCKGIFFLMLPSLVLSIL